MKVIIYFLLFTGILFAQTPNPVLQDQMNFEPGELIVKLKDNVDTGITYAKSGKAKSDFNIGQLLGISDKVKSSTMMFHQKSIEASIANSQKMKAVYAAKAAANPNNGYQPKEPLTMKNIFVLKTLNQQENILMLIEEIKNNPNVEYAEPNYIYGIDNFEVGETITAEEASKMTTSNSSSTIEVNDPLYSSQSNITSTNIDDVWEQYTTGDGSQVIAILDTGGDYTHPDLEANTWINTEELNGVEGYDDDGNGYIDDIRGWDFINLDNAPLDDNMHGTHVAGIAGAVGNNGIGIAGAAWNVKLMHIKVFQSTGQGSSTTIAAGVEYASSNGATIINMSFGSYVESATLKLALENAYATAILVAAAGNNQISINPCFPSLCRPYYPAAYNYVLGVEDRPRPTAGYTNYDVDGPVFSIYNDFLNYELAAPGTGIMSTVPNGGYATLTGTSMSTPLVAGALALYNEQRPDDSKELMFANLINTSENPATLYPGFVDFLAAIEVEPIPKLAVISSVQRDTISGQNGNGFWEPGETVEILPLIKNYWGPTDDVRVGIEFAEFEDTSKATIVQDEIQIGSISAYAILQDLEETLKITISNEINHNIDIKFILTAWSGPNQEYMSDPIQIIITSTKAIIFSDYISEDLTLTNDTEWIFTNSMIISNGATLTIEAGTVVKMSENTKIIVDPYSKLYSNGTAENPVIITSYSNFWKGVNVEYIRGNQNEPEEGNYNESWKNLDGTAGLWDEIRNFTDYSRAQFNFTVFKNFGTSDFGTTYFDGPGLYTNCDFREFYDNGGSFWSKGVFDKCNLRYGVVTNKYFFQYGQFAHPGSGYRVFTRNMNITSLNLNIPPPYPGPDPNPYDYYGVYKMNINSLDYNLAPLYQGYNQVHLYDIFNQSGGDNGEASSPLNPNLGAATQESGILDFPTNVWTGTNNEAVISQKFLDYTNSTNFLGILNYDTRPSAPFENNHATVWKVLVNGYDAQDEYALLDPVGVGTHEFKVYFNRAMDTSVNPQISYGVRLPYNQNIISETGIWSSDGKIYTVTHEVNIGAADGINRIRVQDARDLDLFEITRDYTRFNFLLQSAGSASTGFFAAGGLGKIDLEWVAPSTEELDDVLGYNMYRYEVDADGVESDPVKLNESLIVEDTDESTTGIYFTDYDVLEGQTYFYKYKILRTSFEETDYSNAVSTAPLTSTLGDSNGDFSVDVLDLVHDVDYILGNNPTPFIFLAGDVNADLAINVLDIVGTVDIILNPSTTSDSSVGSNGIQFYPSEAIGNANFTWEGNDLYIESMHNVGGIQLAFNSDFEYVLSEDLPTIEHLDYTQEDSKILMLYSFNNTMIASSKTKILTRLDASQEFDIEQAVVGTTTGAKLTAVLNNGVLSTIDAPFQSNKLQFLSLYPNPSKGLVNLEYYLPEQMDQVTATVYDLQGRKVYAQQLTTSVGSNESTLQLSKLRTGSYIVLMSGYKKGGVKYLSHKILILE
ncbi:S8 family serine peptidase [Polaribacter sp.]|nr:S8 family serine peptidase [Polaribacter sp.]